MFNGSGLSGADVLALTNKDANSGWGSDGGWWVIILFALIFGWGNGGWGGFGNAGVGASNACATQAEVQRGFDLQTITGTLNGIENSVINGFDRITNYTNQGFAGLNTAIVTEGFETRNAITQNTIAGMQNANALQSQLAQCCCDNREAIANVNYNIATQSCATNNAIQTATRDIIDAITRQSIEAKDAKIAEQASQIQALNLSASQCAQNQYLINQLRTPAPVPAFVVANPYCNCGSGCCGYGA